MKKIILTNGRFVIGQELLQGELYLAEGRVQAFFTAEVGDSAEDEGSQAGQEAQMNQVAQLTQTGQVTQTAQTDQATHMDQVIQAAQVAQAVEAQEYKRSFVQDANVEYVDCQGGIVGPGFIDLHVHGGGGADVMDGTRDALDTMTRAHALRGTTRLLLTTVTAEHEKLRQVCQLTAAYLQEAKERVENNRVQGAIPLGLHIEGPYIAPSKKGAQNGEYIRLFSFEEVEQLHKDAQGSIRIMTLAPERLEDMSFLQKLKEIGILPSVGHTEASYELMQEAFEHGATHMTHLCNAMPGIHHRSPGPIVFALNQDGCTVEFIADGIHVHPALIQMALRAKRKDEVIVVTDAMSAMGQEDGQYELGSLAVTVRDGIARLEDGTLAGSTLHMEKAYQLLHKELQLDPVQLFTMMSSTPARIIGVDDQFGSLEAGKVADLVILKDNQVADVMVAGQWIVK